jgi:hypothetical protein
MKTAFMALLLGLAMSAAAGSASANPVSTSLFICNKTAGELSVVVGYHSPGVNDPADHSLLTGPFVSEGWETVHPGKCGTFPNRFAARYMFWFGFIPPKTQAEYDHLANEAWLSGADDSDYHFCITNYLHNWSGPKIPDFTYESENRSSEECNRAGGGRFEPGSPVRNLWVKVQKVDTWVNPVADFTGQ